jgi:hypothetical protein
MKGKIRFVLAIMFLVITALACQAVRDPETQSDGGIILNDNFSSVQWGTGTDADSSVEYVNGALQMIIYRENHFVWSKPDDGVYENIHMEVNVINNGTDSTTAFGFICNKATGNNFYYLVMTPAGQYAIALAKDGEADVFLTNNDQWADSDLIAVNADSYRLGADCGNGKLTLYVDGQEVASVNDSTYTQGQVAVLVWSSEEIGMINNVSFDDFLMKELE